MRWQTRPFVLLIAVASLAFLLAGAMQAEKPKGAPKNKFLRFYDEKLAAKHLIPDGGDVSNLQWSDRLETVSLVRLPATPDRYHGKAVRITGFLHEEFEDHTIFLSAEDGNYLNTENGLWVSLEYEGWKGKGMDPEQFNRKHVIIEGVFDNERTGHGFGCPGSIRHVWRVQVMQKFYND